MSPSLAESVALAFSDDEYPRHAEIAVRTYDDEGISQHFRNTHWRDHSLAALENYPTALEFFTPEAFCFFLPAYMLASLEHPQAGIADRLLDKLSPPKNDTRRPSYSSWWSRL